MEISHLAAAGAVRLIRCTLIKLLLTEFRLFVGNLISEHDIPPSVKCKLPGFRNVSVLNRRMFKHFFIVHGFHWDLQMICAVSDSVCQYCTDLTGVSVRPVRRRRGCRRSSGVVQLYLHESTHDKTGQDVRARAHPAPARDAAHRVPEPAQRRQERGPGADVQSRVAVRRPAGGGGLIWSSLTAVRPGPHHHRTGPQRSTKHEILVENGRIVSFAILLRLDLGVACTFCRAQTA